jgi:tRNA 2-thiocytidine biosynthesis protein TtcA
MQKILGYMRKAIFEFDLIKNGDRIAVGVSGGKDSVVMLKGLVLLKKFIGINYDIVAITLDPQFNKTTTNYEPITQLCEQLGVEHIIERTDIGEIVFDIRKETNPCSLCARMRRGALHDQALKANCNKVALGHHYDDAIETFMMNLFNEGRIGCFSPISYLSRKDLTLIRPLVFAPESAVKSCANRNQLPIIKSKCSVDGYTSRQKTKEFLADQEKQDHGFKLRLFGAMRRGNVSGWGYKNEIK